MPGRTRPAQIELGNRVPQAMDTVCWEPSATDVDGPTSPDPSRGRVGNRPYRIVIPEMINTRQAGPDQHKSN
jgi:hypothetical protein